MYLSFEWFSLTHREAGWGFLDHCYHRCVCEVHVDSFLEWFPRTILQSSCVTSTWEGCLAHSFVHSTPDLDQKVEGSGLGICVELEQHVLSGAPLIRHRKGLSLETPPYLRYPDLTLSSGALKQGPGSSNGVGVVHLEWVRWQNLGYQQASLLTNIQLVTCRPCLSVPITHLLSKGARIQTEAHLRPKPEFSIAAPYWVLILD